MGNKLSYPEVDLSGKVAIVTGGNTGIGYETAKTLARMGAHTFIACRSKERAIAAIEHMKEELGAGEQSKETESKEVQDTDTGSKEVQDTDTGSKEVQDTDTESKVQNADAGGEKSSERGNEEEVKSKNDQSSTEEKIKVEFLPLDLASFKSTTAFVTSFKKRNLPVHILVNNAAVCAVPFALTEDGLESQLQINHLGPMLLTLELMPVLLDTAASSGDVRIAFVSSYAHAMSSAFNAEELNVSEQNYQRLDTYSRTKLYNVMAAVCLQRRIPGKNITVSSLHPGYVKTELSRGMQDKKGLMFLHQIAVNTVGRKPAAGAATTLNCVVNPELNSQQHFYYDSCRQKQSSADSRNEQFQEQMWTKSLEFLKQHLSQDTIKNYGPRASADEVGPPEVSASADEVGPPEVSASADEVGPPEVSASADEVGPPEISASADEVGPPEVSASTDEVGPPEVSDEVEERPVLQQTCDQEKQDAD